MINKKIEIIINMPRMADHANEEGNFSRGLYQLIKENFSPEFRVIQIGTYEGVTAVLFALTCREVITIDPYADGYLKTQETKDNLIQAEKIATKRLMPYPNVRMFKCTSKEFYDSFQDKVDAIYIDGDHTREGVTYDLSHWKNKIKTDGFICGHDVGDLVVSDVIEKELGGYDKRYEDGSWVKQIV